MSGGSSPKPCSPDYAGPYAFSETETKTMSKFISTIQEKLVAYIAFHSYSQFLLIPYGYTNKHVDNYDELVSFFRLLLFFLSIKSSIIRNNSYNWLIFFYICIFLYIFTVYKYEIGFSAANKLEARYGTEYVVGSIPEIICK